MNIEVRSLESMLGMSDTAIVLMCIAIVAGFYFWANAGKKKGKGKKMKGGEFSAASGGPVVLCVWLGMILLVCFGAYWLINDY